MSINRNLTVVEIVAGTFCATIACAVVAFVFLIPRMTPDRRYGGLGKDMAEQREIHRSFLVFAESNNGRLPIPGLVNRLTDQATQMDVPAAGEENVQKNLTRHLYSLMIAQEYFNTDILISPMEENPRIIEYQNYNYDQYRPADDIYWDGDDAVNGAGDAFGLFATLDGTNDEPCHTSFAHLALFGHPKEVAWRSALSPDRRRPTTTRERGTMVSTQPILCTRLPWQRATSGNEFENSFSLLFCGDPDIWFGNVTFADNHVESMEAYPEGDDELGMTKSVTGAGFEQYHEELDQ